MLTGLQREGLVRSIGSKEAVPLRLSDEEMDAIAGLDSGERSRSSPGQEMPIAYCAKATRAQALLPAAAN